jgi:ABC-type nitrate/sulfonate/bicarbonate transport system substrate-binding protein
MLKLLSLLCAFVVGAPTSVLSQSSYLASYAGFSGGQGPTWTAKELGLFKKYGLNADLIFVQGGSRGAQALLAGNTQFYLGDAIAPISANLSGANIVIIGAYENRIPGALITRKEITNPQDLRGKKVGIGGFGGSNELSVVLALRKWNIPRDAVTWLQAGGSPDRMLALMSGVIDASPLLPPQSFEAPHLGNNVLIDFAEIPAFPQTAIAVRRNFLESNRNAVKLFIQALSEGIYQFSVNKEQSTHIYLKYFRTKNTKVVEDTYNYYRNRFSVPPRVVTGAGFQLAVQMTAQRLSSGKEDTRFEQLVDQGVVDELEKEGFFKKFARSDSQK